MFKYETHLHTFPVSRCAKVSVSEALDFYKNAGYDGVFITNHFLDGNLNYDYSAPYRERINFYFSDYEEGLIYGRQIGLKVFSGVELSKGGTDFLVYGLDKDWFLAHPEIMDMKKSEELPYLAENGAAVIQAHPFREAGYIDHIRLYPRCIQGVEVINACRTDFENKMAAIYAESYNLKPFAGSDNHSGGAQTRLAGMQCENPINSEAEFVRAFFEDRLTVFKNF